MKIYTGVGSRKISSETIELLTGFILRLNKLDYCCRTGDAKGCDALFVKHSKRVYAYSPANIDYNDWTLQEVLKYIPNDRNGFQNWKPYVQNLLRRNMMQVLGPDGDKPSEFLICWAPSTYYLDSSAGGTGYAIRCALAHEIPVYNLFDHKAIIDLENLLKEKEKDEHPVVSRL
jgi:hypothetical protein